MAEISQAKQTAEWTCRILITADLYLVISGYLSWFQEKHQLISPLIPQSILYDVADTNMKASIATSIGLLAGLWCYFFQKRTVAIIVLGVAGLAQEIILLFFKG